MADLIVHKITHYRPINVDPDGTPRSLDGERMVEVEPGQWMHPTGAALLDFLRQHLGEQLEDHPGQRQQGPPSLGAGLSGADAS